MDKKLTVNLDGWSIAGCSIIYAPRGQAGEYAKLATNPYFECEPVLIDGDWYWQE